jgi:hypothetical protein
MEHSLIERMCRARGTLKTATIPPAVASILVPASTNRASLTFFGASAKYQLGLVNNAAAVADDVGIIIPALSPTPVILTLATHGDLVQQCFYVVVDGAANVSITYAEAIFQGS